MWVKDGEMLLEKDGQYITDEKKNAFRILLTIELRYEIRQDLVINLTDTAEARDLTRHLR